MDTSKKNKGKFICLSHSSQCLTVEVEPAAYFTVQVSPVSSVVNVPKLPDKRVTASNLRQAAILNFVNIHILCQSDFSWIAKLEGRYL